MIQTPPSSTFNEVVRVISGLIKPKRHKTTGNFGLSYEIKASHKAKQAV